MTDDEKMSNLEEIVSNVAKLSEANKIVAEEILELIAKGQQAIQEKNYEMALEKYIWPTLVMLSLDFVRHFVAENLPKDELEKMLVEAVKRNETIHLTSNTD
jgi:hypothetical protein